MQQNVRLFQGSDVANWCGNEIPIKTIIFPGGEPHVEILGDERDVRRSNVTIDARVGSMNDFMTAMILADAVRRLDPAQLNLFMPYFPGARQDRPESNFALSVKVFAEIVNDRCFDEVQIMDPHSAVTEALLDRCKVIDHTRILARFLVESLIKTRPIGLISPDAGAERKTLHYAKALGLQHVVFARKKRDPLTGKLSGFQLDKIERPGHYLIIDDICDGGGTFLGLGEEFKKQQPESALHLFVTHGIFSKGFEDLLNVFHCVGATDSFPGQTSDSRYVHHFQLIRENN